jgi:SAM-dependent methyltransferase
MRKQATNKGDVFSAYAEDLAFVHDVGFGEFAQRAGPGLLNYIHDAGRSGGTIVDLGCGSGIWARQLVDAGFDAVGVDISHAMVETASQRVAEATFHVRSFLDFEFPNCRGVTALGEVLAYLFDGRNSRHALRRVCQRVYRALEPEGMLIFDLPEIGLEPHHRRTFFEGPGWTCLVEYDREPRRKQLLRRIVTYRKVGRAYRRHEELHRVQLYRAADVATMLRGIGFRVRTTRQYGSFPLPPHRIAFLARR